eukprot:3480833-Rhodomonas_salina.1
MLQLDDLEHAERVSVAHPGPCAEQSDHQVAQLGDGRIREGERETVENVSAHTQHRRARAAAKVEGNAALTRLDQQPALLSVRRGQMHAPFPH